MQFLDFFISFKIRSILFSILVRILLLITSCSSCNLKVVEIEIDANCDVELCFVICTVDNYRIFEIFKLMQLLRYIHTMPHDTVWQGHMAKVDQRGQQECRACMRVHITSDFFRQFFSVYKKCVTKGMMYLQCALQLSLYVVQLQRLVNFCKITEPTLRKFVPFVRNFFKFCRDRFLLFPIVAHVDKVSFGCSTFCILFFEGSV